MGITRGARQSPRKMGMVTRVERLGSSSSMTFKTVRGAARPRRVTII